MAAMKDFVIVGPMTALQYCTFFPLLKEGKVFVGPTHINKFKGGVTITNWYNTLSVCGKELPPQTEKYTPEKYPKYDNYEAIEVGRISKIPQDYEGVMGVPVSFFNYRNDLYEVIGYVNGCKTEGAKYLLQGRGTPNKKGTIRYNLFCRGKEMYSRVLIEKK